MIGGWYSSSNRKDSRGQLHSVLARSWQMSMRNRTKVCCRSTNLDFIARTRYQDCWRECWPATFRPVTVCIRILIYRLVRSQSCPHKPNNRSRLPKPTLISRPSLLPLIPLLWPAERYLPGNDEFFSQSVSPRQGWPRQSIPQEQETKEALRNKEAPELWQKGLDSVRSRWKNA